MSLFPKGEDSVNLQVDVSVGIRVLLAAGLSFFVPSIAASTETVAKPPKPKEIHLILGDCSAAGFKPLTTADNKPIAGRYLRVADAPWTDDGLSGGSTRIKSTDLPATSAPIAAVYPANVTNVSSQQENADVVWLEADGVRNFRRPDRGNRMTLAANFGQDPSTQTDFLPSYISLSFCVAKK
jgi:hypothetical protein